VGLTTLPCKKENFEKPPRNSAGFCGGGQGLSWAVEPRKEVRRRRNLNSDRALTQKLYSVRVLALKLLPAARY
jgi:hypothetical protein